MAVNNALNIQNIGLVLFDGVSHFVSGSTQVGCHNLGITYSAGTFTISDSSGTALSSSNPGVVTFQNNSSIGKLISLTVTNPYTFTDAAGTNELGANLFGITTGVAWGQDAPFYLYAVINSAQNDVAFGIGRVPHLTVSPVAGNLAISGTTLASTQGSLFLLKKNGSTPTVANFASQPVVCIGSFRMQATSTPAWTVQALSATNDGIGNFNENHAFSLPLGQQGAASGTFFLANGGTAPIFSSNGHSYYPKRNGQVDVCMVLSGDGGTDGAGSVDALVALPYYTDGGFAGTLGIMYVLSAVVSVGNIPTVNTNQNKTSTAFSVVNTANNLKNSDFSNGNRTFDWCFSYQMHTA